MAADAAIKLLLNNLGSLAAPRVNFIFGVEEERQKLCSNLTRIQAVLEDAELNPSNSRADRDWLVKLQDAMFLVEDILDECNTHFSKADHEPHSVSFLLCLGEFLSTCCRFMKGIPFRLKIGMRMKEAIRTLDTIAKEHANYQRIVSRESQPSNIDAAARETGPLLNKTEPFIGREDETKKIVDILVNKVKNHQEISILPIVGIGGIGKTTLARLVFNDPRIVEHFEKRLWACVSDNCDAVTVIRHIIESGKESAPGVESLGALQQCLRDLLIQKRYLLVLDDVWNEKQLQWSELKRVLSWGEAGSSIVISTRLRNVSQIMGTLPAHNLGKLTEEQCWMLLKQCAFQSDEEGQYPNLEVIGRQIARKCAGVPLAAKALGSFLQYEKTEKEWNRVKDSELWKLAQKDIEILPALKLSYNHLPLHLRQCFVYCAIFPKNSLMAKEDLIQRWMAHEYISSEDTLDVEDVGEKIYNELIGRSFFETSEISKTIVKMHDLFHDLAQSIMESKFPRTQVAMMPESKSDWKIREVNFKEGYVAFPKSTPTGMDISSISKKYNRLRVLDASFHKIEYLPSTVGSLQHLRLLNLAGTYLCTMPESICGLWNLQVLNLARTYLCTMPESICGLWNLQVLNLSRCHRLELICKKPVHWKNLRHLLLEWCTSLRETPSNIRESTSLKTLPKFIVGRNKGQRLEELEHLNQLEGRLDIEHLNRVEILEDAKKAKLLDKCNLRLLILSWQENYSSSSRGEDLDDRVLEALEPHSNMKSLTISHFRGRHFPTWMKMSNMVNVTIEFCKNIMRLSPLEEMPHLASLKLSNLRSTEYIGHGGNETSIYFPALRKLELYELPNLKGLLEAEAGQQMCPQLKKLDVERCPILVLPSLTSLQKLRVKNNLLFSSELLKCSTNLKELDLEIWHPDEQCLPLDLSPLQEMPHLVSLKLMSLKGVEYIGHGGNETSIYFPALKRLDLSLLPNLKGLLEVEVGQNTCPQLQELKVYQCPILVLPSLTSLQLLTWLKNPFPHELLKRNSNLKKLDLWYLDEQCFRMEWLHHNLTLEEIKILNCWELVEMSGEVRHLHSLKRIYLGYLPKMVYVPEVIRYLPSLECLEFTSLKNLTSLPDWLSDLTSLREFVIYNCPRLTSLPDSIQRMKYLQSLIIFRSPDLERRCKKETGEEWHKIAHIPRLEIG